MPRDPDDGLPGDTPRERPNKPPSQMTPAERKIFNAPDEMGGYSKGGKVVAKKMAPAKKNAAPARKAAPAKRRGRR